MKLFFDSFEALWQTKIAYSSKILTTVREYVSVVWECFSLITVTRGKHSRRRHAIVQKMTRAHSQCLYQRFQCSIWRHLVFSVVAGPPARWFRRKISWILGASTKDVATPQRRAVLSCRGLPAHDEEIRSNRPGKRRQVSMMGEDVGDGVASHHQSISAPGNMMSRRALASNWPFFCPSSWPYPQKPSFHGRKFAQRLPGCMVTSKRNVHEGLKRWRE